MDHKSLADGSDQRSYAEFARELPVLRCALADVLISTRQAWEHAEPEEALRLTRLCAELVDDLVAVTEATIEALGLFPTGADDR